MTAEDAVLYVPGTSVTCWVAWIQIVWHCLRRGPEGREGVFLHRTERKTGDETWDTDRED